MPLTKTGRTVLSQLKKKHGSKKGEEIFYASINAGKLKGMKLESKRKK